jgi:hypothetical protein
MNTVISRGTALKIQTWKKKGKKAGNNQEKEDPTPNLKAQGMKRQPPFNPRTQEISQTKGREHLQNSGSGNCREKAEENTREESPTEETRENLTPEVREIHSPTEEEEQCKSPPRKDARPDIEEGEVSSDSDYEGASDALVTPKKTGRGRKSKKEERDKETYKDVLKGSQPTIRQLINVRQTRKHSKASQGGQSSPQGNL